MNTPSLRQYFNTVWGMGDGEWGMGNGGWEIEQGLLRSKGLVTK